MSKNWYGQEIKHEDWREFDEVVGKKFDEFYRHNSISSAICMMGLLVIALVIPLLLWLITSA